jgi:tRNA(Ile)-lysidine synthase
VGKVSSELKVRFISCRKDVKKVSGGDSLEQAGRLARFDFFLNCCRRFGAKKIALAHNKDDVAETVVMRMLRGSALRGLRAILPKVKYKSAILIRPLIDVSKDDILNWLKVNKIDYRIDKTNLEQKFLRNKIRHKLIPLLKEVNPNIVNVLANTAKVVGRDYDFIHGFSVKEFNGLAKLGNAKIKLNLEKLKKLHPAIINSVLRIAIEEIKGDLRRLELRHFDELVDLVFNRPESSIVHLPNLEIRKDNNCIIIKSLIL